MKANDVRVVELSQDHGLVLEDLISVLIQILLLDYLNWVDIVKDLTLTATSLPPGFLSTRKTIPKAPWPMIAGDW